MSNRYKPPDVTVMVIVIVLLLLGVLCAVMGLAPTDAPGSI
jgi:hypothetical protein